jgi:L-seryl-tRNA(Ser) seleniumtransferase
MCGIGEGWAGQRGEGGRGRTAQRGGRGWRRREGSLARRRPYDRGVTADPRRLVPHTDAVLADPALAEPIARLGRRIVKDAVAAAQQRVRAGDLAPDAVAAAALATLPASATSLRPVINASGTVVHTNLGRSPLSAAAVDALRVAAGTSDLELDLDANRRGRRGRGALAALAAAVPDAGGVHVVNNGAAAVFLAALALATSREIVVSRGELVEIGDGFRIPELIESTGARLREVGTTNRTSLRDYADAIGDDTAFVLKVHPSNFAVTGFTASVGIADLRTLGVPVVADIGSGLLQPDPLLPDEPDATTALRAGAALVTASGDKLLGGPQCGLLLGDAELVERLRRHPAARALRVGKLTLAALEATLRGPHPPTWHALHADAAALRARAEQLAAQLRRHGVEAIACDSMGVVGGGGAPGVELPGSAIALPAEFARPLRLGVPAVLGRVEKDRLLLDLRCVVPDDDAVVCDAVVRVNAHLR